MIGNMLYLFFPFNFVLCSIIQSTIPQRANPGGGGGAWVSGERDMLGGHSLCSTIIQSG